MTWALDVTGLVDAYRLGTADPVAVLAETQARIDRLDPALNAFTARASDLTAQAEAAAARWQAEAPLGPLDGVPLIVKDNLCAKGLPAAWGNGALAQRIVAEDEAPVAALRRAGALILGKGNTPEFAVEGVTDNLTFGPTRNPFDPARTPGGSSGGVVAAVAAGLAHAGLGTDGGGSIRRPAGYTGLYGLKPSLGRIPRAGGLAQVLLDFEVVGPLARSLRDLVLLDAVLSGTDPAPAPARPARILAVPTLDAAPCDPEIRAAFAAMAQALRLAGHDVVEGPLPVDLGLLTSRWTWIGEIGLARYLATDPEVAAAAAPKYREMAARGAAHPTAEVYELCEAILTLRQAARGLWGYDAVLMPASAAHPWPVTEPFPTEIDGQAVGPRGHAVYTGWVNAAGLPALALPAPVATGLPIGMQLIGPMGADADLARLAESIATPFRWPDLALTRG